MFILDKLMYFLYLWYKIEIMSDEFNSFLNYFCLRWVGIDYIKNFLVMGIKYELFYFRLNIFISFLVIEG